MAEYQEVFNLPSRGLFYKDKKLSSVSLRPIKVMEEKTMFGSSSPKVLNTIMENCITNPLKLKVTDLVSQDKFFILFNLRLISLGTEYKINYRCSNPDCEKMNEEVPVDLGSLNILELPVESTEFIPVKLSNGDSLNIRQLTTGELEMVEEKAKERQRKFPKTSVGEHSYIFRMARSIVDINGEPKEMSFLEEYLNDLIMKDSNLITNAMNKYEFGVDTRITVECEHCGNDNKIVLPMTNEFFRPTGRI